jgi:hypothetical protein
MNPPAIILIVTFAILGCCACTKSGRDRLVFFFIDNGDIRRSADRRNRKRTADERTSHPNLPTQPPFNIKGSR